jgi:hypothetical protein
MSDPGDPVGAGGQAMRVRGAQGAMVLAARRAARALRCRRFRLTVGRWLPRRSSMARTSAWRPLLLRWARTAAPVGGGGAGHASVAAPVSWYHWHFHGAMVPGSGPARGAPPASGPAQAPAVASRGHAPGAGRIGATGGRGVPGQAGTIERPRVPAASAQPAGGGWPRPAAFAASVRWRAKTAGPRAQATSAPAAQPFGPARAAGRNAAQASRPASAPLTTPAGAHGLWRQTPGQAGRSLPWAMRAPGADDAFDAPRPPAARRPPGEQAWRANRPPATATRAGRAGAAPGEKVQAGPGAFLRHAHAQAARTPPWPQRGQAAHAFDAPRAPVRRLAPGEQAWRAREPAPAALVPGQGAAARTMAAIAIGRPVDLVWPAAAASAAAPGAAPRFGSAPAVGAASAPSMPAAGGATARGPAPAGRSGNDSVVRATALDPVLANRLADEVIRRIDHRARIERERRGL